nr:reverse transcriptase domain-containing protein [Tanacetum cinerariifolium]
IDEDNLTDPSHNLVDTIPEMFTDEHTLDYSSPPLYDDFDDDLDEFESNNDDAYNDPFDSKEDKINESKLLIDELDFPRSSNFFPFPEYDLFLFEDFSKHLDGGGLIKLCMRTRSSSSNLSGESSPNLTSLNPNRRNRRCSNQPFILKESPVDTMVDKRTMAELLCAPTEGYTEAIVAPPILAEHFELKHSLINMMTSDQFFGLGKDNRHDHINLLRACPHHAFTELHQLDTFYNALNPTDQDSLNSAAGNLLERRTQDVLTIIENKSKVRNSRNESIVSQVKSSDANSSSSSEKAKLTHAVNQQTSVVTTAMTVILKQFQATPPPAFVKSVEEICVTCGDAHPYYQYLTTDSNTFPEFGDNIKGYVSAATVNYNQAISTRSVLVLDGPSVPLPHPFINPDEDKRVEETLTYTELGEFTIKVPPFLVQKAKPPSQRNYVVHQRPDNDDAYNDPFDSKGEKIKESKLLIDELDLLRSSDFLHSPEYDSFFFEDFSVVDALPSIDNEDKDFDPPLYELPFHKEVLRSETLLLFSSKNEEKVFKPEILTSKGVLTSSLSKLSHRGPKAFKVIKIFESSMEIFPCSFGEDIRILDVPCLHFYPP